MPHEKTITVYRFNELPANAKQKAKDNYAESFGYAWAKEAITSLKKLADHFDGKVADYSIDFFRCGPSTASFSMPNDMDADDIASRLDSLGTYNRETLKGHGDCKLTGYCADEDAIDGFRKPFHEGERDLPKLMHAAFKSWLQAAQDDCESQYSDDAFSEHADANEYEYEQHGRMSS
jgi:hypothetical protein